MRMRLDQAARALALGMKAQMLQLYNQKFSGLPACCWCWSASRSWMKHSC